MAVKLNYRLKDWGTVENWAEATAEDLRYRLVLGDLLLTVGDHDYSAEWGWIPLLDTLAAVSSIIQHLEHYPGKRSFEFTESDATLEFSRHGDEIHLKASYRPAAAAASIADWKKAVADFGQRLRAEVLTGYPELAQNREFKRLLG
jgi:hypothetical protein